MPLSPQSKKTYAAPLWISSKKKHTNAAPLSLQSRTLMLRPRRINLCLNLSGSAHDRARSITKSTDDSHREHCVWHNSTCNDNHTHSADDQKHTHCTIEENRECNARTLRKKLFLTRQKTQKSLPLTSKFGTSLPSASRRKNESLAHVPLHPV